MTAVNQHQLPREHVGLLTTDEAMARALELATRGPGGGANPQVGCVILALGPDDSPRAILGEGWHDGAGTAHAEVAALASATERDNNVRGATAIVTLQPCNSTGRTGPCAQALIAAGIGAVRYATMDPAATTAQSDATLRAAGVDVGSGLYVGEARELLHAWFGSLRLGRPYVTLKTATTIDGRVAAPDGTSRWITGTAAREHAHRERSRVGAIVVGTGTALVDDPTLSAREPDGTLAAHQPMRVVVGHSALAPEALLRTSAGGTFLQIPTRDPNVVLAELAARDVRHVLVEGGPRLAAAFVGAGLVDELHSYVAPVVLGAGRSAIETIGITTMTDAPRWRTVRVEQLGEDALLVARRHPDEGAY